MTLGLPEKGAYHCYIRFPEILHQSGLTPDAGRKILIRIDSEAKERLYEPEKVFLNKFTVYRQILAAPAEILLAQKMMTVLYRKREKGRDIYDVSFLMGFAIFDFIYIQKILGMDQAEFLRRFDERLAELDLNFLARNVEPFLFSSEHQERVTTFRDYLLKKSGGAEIVGLKPVGTLWIILQAVNAKIIDFDECLSTLEDIIDSGFYLKDEIYIKNQRPPAELGV